MDMLHHKLVFIASFIDLLNHSPMSKIQHKVSFLAEFNRFEVKVFLLLDWLPYYS